MQFLVLAYDGTDEEALSRRLAVREEHMALAEKMHKNGAVFYGAAMLDQNEKMIGSMMVVNFANRAALDAWLEVEPYVTGNVWQKVDVTQCRVAPVFSHLIPAGV